MRAGYAEHSAGKGNSLLVELDMFYFVVLMVSFRYIPFSERGRTTSKRSYSEKGTCEFAA